MMKIYTKRGDKGQTGLIGGRRCDKDDPLMEACGAVDELNSALGWVRGQDQLGSWSSILDTIQRDLFVIGAEIANPDSGTETVGDKPLRIGSGQVQALEQIIDQLDTGLPTLKQFILPGGSGAGAALHVTRSICRRAERRVCSALKSGPANPDILCYLNRLSDLLFMLARSENQRCKSSETLWP